MTLPHHGKFKYATQPPGPSLKGWATSVPKMVKWAYLGRPLTDLAEIKNPGFKFHPGHFEPGWARLGPKWKFADFQNSTSYGSVEVSGAQISNFFEIGSLEPEYGPKTCPKMAHFLPKVEIFNFFENWVFGQNLWFLTVWCSLSFCLAFAFASLKSQGLYFWPSGAVLVCAKDDKILLTKLWFPHGTSWQMSDSLSKLLQLQCSYELLSTGCPNRFGIGSEMFASEASIVYKKNCISLQKFAFSAFFRKLQNEYCFWTQIFSKILNKLLHQKME